MQGGLAFYLCRIGDEMGNGGKIGNFGSNEGRPGFEGLGTYKLKFAGLGNMGGGGGGGGGGAGGGRRKSGSDLAENPTKMG